MKKVTVFSIFFLSFFIGAGLFLAQNKASATTTLPRACSVSITSPSNYQVVNPNQDLTISYTITCSSGRFIRANIYFTATGDPYTQYNPSSHCAWTFQVSGTHYYSVTYPSAGLLRAKQIEGATAHFYVDVNEYARDDNPPGCSLDNSAYYAFQDLRWVRFEEPQPHYACNTSTWQCYESSTGPYTSLSQCQANCVAPSPCIINSFTANPNPLSYNGSTSLSWSTSNCNSCTASASPSNSYWYGSKSTSGSTSIYNLTQTTTFTLSCSGSSGSDTKSVTVNMQTPSLNASCYASPNPAQVNQVVTFTANVSGGVSPYSYSWSGAVSGNSQSVTKTFSNSGTYTAYLTVTDSASQTKTTSCSVEVQETPRQISLSANPLTVDYNGSTVLSWSASGYDSCQGYAEPRNSQWDTSVSFSGTKTITNLTQTTTFYLKCYYNFISNYDTRSVTVNVNSQIIRYACNTSTWQCYQSSTGPYTSLSACQADCQQPVIRYACNTSTWQCYQSSTGPYTSLSSCQADCQQPVIRYACNTSTWQCYESSTGPYTSLSACQADCQQPVIRYACNTSTWQCYESSTGPYTSLSSCQADCQQPVIRYACNTSTWQCYESSTGPYTSLSACQANCQAPSPCQITNFTANPNPVSYNGNTVLNWTTNNCTSCTASSNPSNSYWYGNKNTNGSSIVYNLTQTTIFTLTCAGYNSTDTKSITVSTSQIPALNVSCYASPNPAQINQTITFYSTVSGGSGNYYYSWAGYAYGSSSSYSRSFSSGGTYWAYLTVTDSDGRSGSASCSVYIESPVNYPTLDFWADKYTLIQGESTYLRWSSFNTTYCTASNGWSGTKSTAGYESASPLNQTTYTLTCYGPNGSVTKSLTLYVVSPSKNISISKLGRNLTNGDRTYEKTFRLADGEVAEFYLVVSAGSNGDLTNVLVKDILPPSLSYRLGTTKVNGVLQPDTITTTGLSLGTIPRNTSKIITFQATGSAPGSYLTQINTAEATATGQDKVTDTASIVFGVVLGAATVKTGPADSLIFLLGISFGLSLLTWYYLTYNPKGKLLYLRIGNKLREMRFNRLRKKILKEKE